MSPTEQAFGGQSRIDASHLSARRQIGAQRRFEFAQASEMVGALIDDLARGIDILDFRDREDGHLALRPALPDRTGIEEAAATKARPVDLSFIGVCMRDGLPIISANLTAGFVFQLVVLSRAALNQPARPRLQAELAPARRSVCSTSTIAPDLASRIL